MKEQDHEAFRKASALFRQHGELRKTADALRAGLHPTLIVMAKAILRPDERSRHSGALNEITVSASIPK